MDVHDCVRVGVCNCQSNYQYYVPLLLATAEYTEYTCCKYLVKGDVQANEMVT